MALALQERRQQQAGAARPDDGDAHGRALRPAGQNLWLWRLLSLRRRFRVGRWWFRP